MNLKEIENNTVKRETCLFQNSLSGSEAGGLCSFGPSLEHDKMTVGLLVNGNLGVLEYTREIPASVWW